MPRRANVHARHGGAVTDDRLPSSPDLAAMLEAAGLAVVGEEDAADRFWMLAQKPG